MACRCSVNVFIHVQGDLLIVPKAQLTHADALIWPSGQLVPDKQTYKAEKKQK
jgi:hypothetical protein